MNGPFSIGPTGVFWTTFEGVHFDRSNHFGRSDQIPLEKIVPSTALLYTAYKNNNQTLGSLGRVLCKLLDLKEAFDTVKHDILLSKMNLYRIRGIALDWFRSYLTNRTERCLVNGSLSRICSLKCEVPKGTILGPLLFFIYINDLPNCLTSCQPRMCADDTHITCANVGVNSIQLNLNHDLGNLNKWLISNKLALNTAKTEFMLIGYDLDKN